MEPQPTAIVSACSPAKPRMLIFDDDVAQLMSYCSKFSKKYAVEGVLVAGSNSSDALLKQAQATQDWSAAAKAFAVDASLFDAVQHVVGSHEELQALLTARQPQFVLSDYQMRWKEGSLSGSDVMHAVAAFAPSAARAVHTGSGCALANRKAGELTKYELEDRIDLVNAMRVAKFRVFPKSPYHKNFDPAPIEAYFAASQERSVA